MVSFADKAPDMGIIKEMGRCCNKLNAVVSRITAELYRVFKRFCTVVNIKKYMAVYIYHLPSPASPPILSAFSAEFSGVASAFGS